MIGGKIQDCSALSSICHYRCCDQARPGEGDPDPENAVLLFPGEYEAVSERARRHLLVVLGDFHGGKLTYCDRDNFDQSSCHPDRNLKPLDCQSYPFAPVIREGELALVIDSNRCPLPSVQLAAHAAFILKRWKEVIEQNPAVADWIASLKLPHYISYSFSDLPV